MICKRPRSSRLLNVFSGLLVLTLGVTQISPASAQGFGEFDRKRGREMLNVVKKDIRNNYFDATFKGIDIDAKFKAAEDAIAAADSNGKIFAIIAQAVIDLDDSHTWFVPPSRTVKINYGFLVQMIGDDCYVVGVRPGSDAESKLAPGDRVLNWAGFKPSRTNLWKINYLLHQVMPRQSVQLAVQSPGGEPRKVEVVAEVKQLGRLMNLTDESGFWQYIRDLEDSGKDDRHRFYEDVEGVFVWKMPGFDLTDQDVDKLMGKAKNRKAIVLDLRGNGGGAVKTLQRMLANLLDKDVKAFDEVKRGETKPVLVKSRGGDAYKGKLVVLIDSESGSASEVLARVVQLEKRGTVIGERSAGAVMVSRFHGHEMGDNVAILYGASITEFDLITADGKSLEKVGVTPDEVLMPTAEDLKAQKDPVLARAIALAGANVSPEKAGLMFPLIWEK